MSDSDITKLSQQVAELALNSGEFATSPKPAEGEDAEVYNLPFDRTFPSFEPMVESESFLDEEYNSPIALLNNKYWETQKEKDNYAGIKARAEKWFQPCNISDAELKDIEDKFTANINALIANPDAKFDRIFIRDSERCFNSPKRRTALCHILTYLQMVTLQGDYHQGLAMTCSFLSCFLSAPKVIAMAIRANEKLLPQVWRARSDASVIDGHVLYSLLQNSTNPKHVELYHHLKKCSIIPEMFIPKYWCGLTVHLLPYQSIISLYDNFWTKNGVLALYECVLTILLGQYDVLLKSNAVNVAFDLVALDHHVLTPTYVNKLTYCYPTGIEGDDSNVISDYAKEAIELVKPLEDFDLLKQRRDEAFRTHIEPLISRTQADFAQFTEAQPDCTRDQCKNASGTGDYFCLDCKVHLCEDCAYSAWDGHNDDDHEVRTNFDLD